MTLNTKELLYIPILLNYVLEVIVAATQIVFEEISVFMNFFIKEII